MEFFGIINSINFQSVEIWLVSIAMVLLIFIVWFLGKNSTDYIIRELHNLRNSFREEIRFSIQPKVIEMSLSVEALVNLAIEVWRIEQRLAKAASGLNGIQRKGMESSTQKLKRYLEKCDIEIRDYTNLKFNEGLNLDILSVEKDPVITEPVVKETVEPTILYKGLVVKKAKIVLLSN